MRIAFDGSTLHPPQTGVGYYTEHLLRALLEAEEGHELLLLSHRPFDEEGWARLRAPGGNAFRSARTLWLQWAAPRLLERLRPDVAHFTNSILPPSGSVPLVLTVHDMSLALFPALHPLRRRLTLPLIRRSIEAARRIITVSESSRSDLVDLGVAAGKIEVIHAAPAPDFRPISDPGTLEEVRRRHRLPRRFVLFLGTIEPRKNVQRLVEAYLALPDRIRKGRCLVLAGRPGWGARHLRRALARSHWGEEVRWLRYVPFSDLPPLLNLAELLVFPSLYEGFGLPVVEAMACGTPVITSNRSAMRELFEGAARLADPEDPEALAAALREVLDNDDLRRHLAGESLSRAAFFSWAEAARRTLQVYREARRDLPAGPPSC